MMDRSPRCYIPSFMEIARRFQRRRFLKGFYPIWAWRPSWLCDQHHVVNLISLYLKAFTQNLIQNGTVVSEKIRFEILYVHNIGPRSRNDIGLQYSHTFINLIRCLLLPTLRSLVAIVSEKPTVFPFSYGNAKLTNFTLP